MSVETFKKYIFPAKLVQSTVSESKTWLGVQMLLGIENRKEIRRVKICLMGWTESPNPQRDFQSQGEFPHPSLLSSQNHSVCLVAIALFPLFSNLFQMRFEYQIVFLRVWGIEKLNLNTKLPLSSLEQLGKRKQSLGEERHKSAVLKKIKSQPRL